MGERVSSDPEIEQEALVSSLQKVLDDFAPGMTIVGKENKTGRGNLYETVIESLGLGEFELKALVVDQEGEVYLSMGDTAQFADLSRAHLRGLVAQNRLDAIKAGGSDLFISFSSVQLYITEGRKKPGPKRKTRL